MVAAFNDDGRGSKARGRGHAATAAAAATSLSAARGGTSSEVRSFGVCAYAACMYMHHATY
jgi:hypothetical protein